MKRELYNRKGVAAFAEALILSKRRKLVVAGVIKGENRAIEYLVSGAGFELEFKGKLKGGEGNGAVRVQGEKSVRRA